MQKIHPLHIFRQSIELWRENILTLSFICVIFTLPILLTDKALSLFGQFALGNKAYVASKVLLNILRLLSFSWMSIVLILFLDRKLRRQENRSIASIIKEASRPFLSYVGTAMLVILAIYFVTSLCIFAVGILTSTAFAYNTTIGILAFVAIATVWASFLVYWGLRWSLWCPFCVLESHKPVAALQSSFLLVKEQTTRVVGDYILVLLTAALFFSPQIFFMRKTQPCGTTNLFLEVYMFAVGIILTPLWTGNQLVVYHKLKEANSL
jgi:hypothetical protein